MALRKMLGSADHPSVIRLMRLIETQNVITLTRWAAQEVGEHMLPLAYDAVPLNNAVNAALAYAAGTASLADVKAAAREARTAAQGMTGDPVRQAAARAIAAACAVAVTPTNALGFTFYSAAAIAYHTAGLEATREEYDALATNELERLCGSLAAACLPGEENPVRVDWGC